MVYLIYILVISSAVLLVLGISSSIRIKPAIRDYNLETSTITRPIKRHKFFKFFTFLVPFNRSIVNKLGRIKIEDKLLASNANMLAEDYVTLKQVLLLSGAAFVFVFKDLLAGQALIWMVVFLALSLIGPDLWLKLRIKKRQKEIVRLLPDVIDLLTLCVNAGLDFSVAVKWVVDKSKPSPLIEELGLLLLETKMGKSRRQALKDMSRRIDLPEVNSFSRALIQAERLGTPVETALTILAEEVRDFRFRRGERIALQAPIKMLFPLIFFIMPVVAVIVGGPVLLQFLQGGFGTPAAAALK